MSYGIGIVIPKEDLNKEKIRFGFCNWLLPITVETYPEECKESFKRWINEFDLSKVTTLDKLKSAPCDCVCIIDKEGGFEVLKGCKPLDCSEESENEYWYDNVEEYLTGIKPKIK